MITPHAAFIHIPRCGGTSVETFFGNILGHHHGWKWYAASYPHQWHDPNFYRFAFVRDPIDRVHSLWNYWNNVSKAQWFGELNKRDDIKRSQEWKFRQVCTSRDEMIEKLPWLQDQLWTDDHFKPQTDFLPDDDSVELIPLDKVTSAWPRICRAAKVSFQTLPHLNGSANNRIQQSPLTAHQLSAIQQFYSRDFDLWNHITTRN